MNDAGHDADPGEALPADDGLDASQRAAVRSGAGALLVVAGPGSGKTRVLTQRIAWRIATESMQARRAMAVTFTRRAARELRSRLLQLDVDDMGPVGTFHAIALAQVRQHDADRGRAERKILPNRTALSDELSEHLQRSFGSRPPITVATALREIDWAKASDLSVADYRDGPARHRLGPAAAEAAAVLFGHFERVKSRRRLLDFDDLLAECTRLMRSDEHFAAAQRWLVRHFFVDEFQDLNRLQWNLLLEWIGGPEAVRSEAADICAVGDLDQAIYGWNGADSRYIAEFDRRFEGAQVIRLELNYRSHPSLVTAAQAVMTSGTDPDVADVGGGAQAPARPHETGPAPTMTAFDDAAAEAAGIAQWIADRHIGRVRWDSFGVLARTNAQIGDIAAALDARGIPCRLSGQRSTFLQLPAVRELLERLRASGADFSTVVEDLRADMVAAEPAAESDERHGPVLARVLDLADAYLAEASGASGRHSGHRRPSGQGFATWVGLLSGSHRELTADLIDADHAGRSFDQRDGAVALATFHAAKGLQWRHVVIAGVEDGLVPLRRDDPEERRLFYVAVSRAARTLHFTWARHRAGRGAASEVRSPSPWLERIAAATAEPPPLSPDDAASRVAGARAALDAARKQ
ncbi:ATP-dependent helicase [Candidatus Poriferisodalis sp.]|uniref:ATP-dependent helicase n=1 Tax=Candidatus Poriferisodalis sp. TaxID=3101277 RepID=UPI003B018983